MNNLYQGITVLLASAVTGERCKLPEGFSLEAALPVINKQNLVPLAFQGALNCGISSKDPVMGKLMQRYLKLLVHSERQMRALQQIFDALEANKIDYLPLKGCQMKHLYPKPELRTMGDADILIREEQYSSLEPILESLGFTMAMESRYDYVWKREDLTVEMHRSLFPPTVQALCRYFGNGWNRAVRESGCRYRFSPEDTFVYQFAHMAKHYQISGIGSRHILDLYVYLRAHPDLDEAYMEAELEKLHLLAFYRNIRKVLKVWFENEAPDEITEHITDFIFSGGSWGSVETGIYTDALRKSLEKGGIQNSRQRSVIQVIFPPAQAIETRYPVLKKAPWLLPVVWIARWLVVILFRRRNIKKKMSIAAGASDEKVLARQQALRYVGLDYEYNVE